MPDVTRNLYVKVLTFDPAQGKMIPVPGARLLCEDSGWLWDPDLSDGTATTDEHGLAQVAITFEDTEEDGLNPFFTITVPEAGRAVPAGAPAERQVALPGEWVTRHYVNRRIPRVADYTDPNSPLEIFVGLPARLRVGYTDFDSSGIRNPLALPEDTVRVYLADYDDFLWIDWLNPDDTMTGFGANSGANRIIPVGQNEEYHYFDAWPTAPCAMDGLPAAPRAWLDPPGASVGSLGGASFENAGPLAVDLHGFVFMADRANNVVHRFYPDGTLCETIPGAGSGVTLNNPGGLALDQYRHLFVADTGNNRLVIFRLDGQEGRIGRYVHETSASPFGSTGSGNGQFNAPRGLAVIPNRAVDGGEVLAVADSGNQRVQLFDLQVTGLAKTSHRGSYFLRVSPVFRSAFGVSGSGAGQLTEPVGVAADEQKRLFVCDRALHRVSRWAPGGGGAYGHEADWEKSGGGSGSGDGEFDSPEAVAVDARNGYVYVAEAGNHRVQRLEADTGNHLAHWSHSYAPPLGSPFTPTAVGVDRRGETYVADTANRRVVRGTVFDGSGAALADSASPTLVGAPWTPRTESEHMAGPAYVCFGPEGKLWVADTGNDRVLLFVRNDSGEWAPATPPPSADLDAPVGMAVDPEGNLFVVDSGNNRVRRYDASLAHQADIGSAGSGANQFQQPKGIALVQRVEPMLYVADTGNNRVQVLRRDGTFTGNITTDGTIALSAPEDVAADSRGNLYVADTGNQRILQFDTSNAFVRAITPSGSTLSFSQPSGVSIDAENKLIVTDRGQNAVFRLEADGTVLAYWDLKCLLAQDVSTSTLYYPELARLLVFATPSRAVMDSRGLLAVADTGHDRVRLVRTHTDLQVSLFDLGEKLPDISFRAVTQADWNEDLGLKLNVGDVSIFDDSHEFVSEPVDDFARDQYDYHKILGPERSTNSAINVMKVVRRAQQWYRHQTRQDEAAYRWGTNENGRTLDVDLISGDGSYQFLDVNLGEDSPDGRRSDAWNDSVVAHEMAHWVFFKALQPYAPFSLVGLFQTSRSHSGGTLGSHNQALTEGWAEFVEHFWGSEFGATDRIRGFPLTLSGLTAVQERGDNAPWQYLFGGPWSGAAPTFEDPGKALQNEGYLSNALYQIHHMLAAPGVLFADDPAYWYRYNLYMTDDQSRRFADTIWRALRAFEAEPPMEDMDRASTVYLRNLLARFRAAHPSFAQAAQSILELNNLLMPALTITEGDSESTPGTAVGESMEIQETHAKLLIVQVKDATGAPLSGYNLNFEVGSPTDFEFMPPGGGPAVQHGRVPSSGLNRATNSNGIVNITYEAPPGSAGSTETMRVTYQPDFDTDRSFSPPEKGEDRETTLRRLYLYELRTVAKVWPGSGNNFGAKASRALTFNIGPD